MEKVADKILAGDERAAARLMRAIEDDLPEAVKTLCELYSHTGKAFIVGVTGAPGVGKSTLLDALITSFRQRGSTVGVVAIDPTSPFTGGALLGDRVRMGKHATDKGVFIRSLASRGWAGGLARAAMSMVHVLDAMGKDVILVEAVGSGQNEVEISRVADTTVVVLSPGAGDEIQMMKAGILEAADVYVVNKADKEGAAALRVQIEQMSGLTARKPGDWIPCIVLTEALNNKGIDEATEALLQHRRFLETSGDIARRRLRRARVELTDAVEYALRQRVRQALESGYLDEMAAKIADRETDPYAAAEETVDKALGARRRTKHLS